MKKFWLKTMAIVIIISMLLSVNTFAHSLEYIDVVLNSGDVVEEEQYYVVLIILEEWTLAVGGEERIPVDVAPVAVFSWFLPRLSTMFPESFPLGSKSMTLR